MGMIKFKESLKASGSPLRDFLFWVVAMYVCFRVFHALR
jgi:hypothetical protein